MPHGGRTEGRARAAAGGGLGSTLVLAAVRGVDATGRPSIHSARQRQHVRQAGATDRGRGTRLVIRWPQTRSESSAIHAASEDLGQDPMSPVAATSGRGLQWQAGQRID